MATVLLLGASACGSSPTATEATVAPGTGTPAVTSTGQASATAASSPEPSAAQPSPSAESASPADRTQWRTYTSADGKVSFEYPGDWTVANAPAPDGTPRTSVEVRDAEGTVLAALDYGPSNGGLGGACQNPVPYSVLDSVELPLPYNTAAADTIAPRYVFRALEEPGRVTAAYGITSSVAGRDGKACMFYNVVSGPADSPLYYFTNAVQVNSGVAAPAPSGPAAKIFPTMDAARAYMQTPEYVHIKRTITSLKIRS
ncbi:hypothetical protein [Pseudarthrobacter sp. C4D7]|uniref:hypothetical protein n=1 Tax=Pseudarthrobacter sp. C4D7 TaxID=2735268 RepID=UPI001585C39A|nr:hypothetical protein [Pseudarthrobacter sp. C4D7]NUT71777.1 hypothetical protein [Pseudarthrobacter sp. C4D7]